MNHPQARKRILNPLELFAEIGFGLIIVLSFTGALSVAQAGKTEVREMLAAAILCNLAWGIIDAAFYLINCLVEYGRTVSLLLAVQECPDPVRAREIIAGVIPPKIAEALDAADFERIHAHLKEVPMPARRVRLTGENWRGALAVLLVVFLSTFPVVIPFLLIQNPRLALHFSNLVAIALLFGTGRMLAVYAGLHRTAMGLAMVAVGACLVGLTLALGG